MQTMASPTDGERPTDAVTVAQRYLSYERPLSTLVGVVVASVFLATYLLRGLLAAVLVGAALVVVIRAPVLRPHGTIRLRSDDDVETVRAAFTGLTPPVLAFQWGIADAVTTANGVPTYVVSYLFGLRTNEVTVQTDTAPTAGGDTRVTLDVTINGHPWATYTATIRDDSDETVVDVAYVAERGFGLRRLPQQLVLRHYRDEALEAQGYTVVERDAQLR
ncbi:hypothetical protein GCM10009000_114470 [Halobacterium noricense]